MTVGNGRLLALACLATCGCSVTYPDVLDDGFFACASAADCGPGQACAEGNVYSADFCRPACDIDDPSSCDGVCTAAGACLTRCTIDPDGAPVGCTGDELACVRIDALRGEGVCYPADSCSRTEDCLAADPGAARLCLNDALGLPASSREGLDFRNLYCTARADAQGRCPSGYLSYQFATSAGVETACYAPCELDGDGPWCPPGTTCFRGFGQIAGTPDRPPCLPGVWGLPCEDDTHCLIGRCLPIGRGRRACTETCAEAEGFGGCGALELYSELFGTPARMSCEDVLGTEVCVPRFDLLSLCSNQLDCVGGDTVCLELDFGETRASVCVRGCRDAADCAEGTGGTADEYRCFTDGAGGVCMKRRPLGARCVDDLDCREGVCCDVGDFFACLTSCPPPG